jgi:hypothetical protein
VTASSFDDDDYDNCDDYDNAFTNSNFDEEWLAAAGDSKRVFEEEPFGEDEDDSSSETASDTDFELAATPSISLHTSTDLLSVAATLSDLPHWWGEEDSEHIEMILQEYTHTLGIDLEQKKSVRSAVPFIGHIIRHQVPSVHSLQSIDEVSVFRYEMVPFGQTMPLIRRHWILTTWDVEAGLPIRQLPLTKPAAHALWLPKARSNASTSLFCEPDAASPAHFVYTVERTYSRDVPSIGYAHSSLSYSRFFPEAAFHGNAPIDD